MPVPKYRTSRSKARMRRGHERMAEIAAAECPHCHESKLPHRVCPHCGYYNGMEIVAATQAEAKAKA